MNDSQGRPVRGLCVQDGKPYIVSDWPRDGHRNTIPLGLFPTTWEEIEALFHQGRWEVVEWEEARLKLYPKKKSE